MKAALWLAIVAPFGFIATGKVVVSNSFAVTFP